MKLQRYRRTNFGIVEDADDGQYVQLDDVLVLLQKLSIELDDPKLEDADLNGSVLVDQYIRDNA